MIAALADTFGQTAIYITIALVGFLLGAVSERRHHSHWPPPRRPRR